MSYPPPGPGYPGGGGGYPPGGGGYPPPPHGGFPPQQGGYPPPAGGYPPGPGGYPAPNSGPPPPPGQWGGGPPGYPPGPGGGGYGYPGDPPGPPPPHGHGGFGGPGHHGHHGHGPPPGAYPPDNVIYGGEQGYGGGYSGSNQPPVGYNTGPTAGGYPPAGGGYPPTQPSGGYPSQPSTGGGYGGTPASYPQGGGAGGYPQQQQGGGGGYPQQQQGGGGGYPQQQQGGGGYPQQQGGGGGYPQQQPSGQHSESYGVSGGGLVKDSRISGHMAGMSISNTQGTVKPVSNFDADTDCEVLRKAMRGMGTDEKTIIDLVTNRSQEQRQKILLQYKTNYGKDLIHALKSELSGHFESSILALFGGPGQYDAICLHRAIEGVGTDEHLLIEILCTRTNAQIREINEAYKHMFHSTLEQDCVSDTSGQFKRVLISMCQANRDESTTVDRAKATLDAQALYKAGEKKWGTEESVFNRILAAKSYIYLRVVFDEYTKVANRDIASTIDREFSGDIRKAYKTVVYVVRNPAQYFAGRINKAIKGAGTDEYALIRMVVSRSEIDMVQIKEEYQRAHSNSLYKAIEGDTSGDFGRVLLNIVGR